MNATPARKSATPPLPAVIADLLPGLTWRPRRGLGLRASGASAARTTHWVAADEALLALRDHVYARYFCRWAPPSPCEGALSPHVSGDSAFVSRLARATGGARYWDHGWRTVSAGHSYAFVSDGEIMLYVDDPDALWPPDQAAGAPASVQLPCARENLSPGFFYLIGTRGRFDRGRPYPRFYLNVAPEAAPDVAAALLSTLDAPFEAKFANDPAAYCRVDPAVLYTGQHDYGATRATLLDLSDRHPDWWREGTPLFSLPLATGIAAAECPREGEETGALESFGHHRCRLLAQGVLAALQGGDATPEAAIAAVAAAFEASGLDLAQPHRHHLSARFWVT